MTDERSTCAVYGPPPMSSEQKVIRSLREEVRFRDCQIESLKLHNSKLRATLRKRMKPLDTVEQASTLTRKLAASQSMLSKAMGELTACRAELTRVQSLYTAELDRTQAVLDALGARAGERVDHAAQRVKGELGEVRRQLDNQRKANETRNRELDALHYVWCSGGCETGVHRYGGTPDLVTEEIVGHAERQAKRLREWWEARKRKSGKAGSHEG